MFRLLVISFIFFCVPIHAVFGLSPTLTPTPSITPTPARTPPLGPGPIVSLWRALPNPIGSGSQQIRIANVGDAGTTLEDRSIYAVSSGKSVSLTGFLGPGEDAYVSLPDGTLDVGGDIIKLIKGGAIYQGYYDGPAAAGRWIQLKWTSNVTPATTPTPTPTPVPTPNGVVLFKILPDSQGDDDSTGEGEKIWIINNTNNAVTLTGWKIIDHENETEQVILLSGTLPAETELELVNQSGVSIFNNDTPDCITLLDAEGKEVDKGTYAVTEEGAETDIVRPCTE